MTALINASTSSGVVVTSDTSGSLAFQSNGTTIMTVASTGVSTQVGAPAFSAYRSGNQTPTTSVWTKVQFNTEEFDTNSNFDPTTNYRFTPTVAGYYQMNANLDVGGSGVSFTSGAFYKNGSQFKTFGYISSSAEVALAGSCLVYMNGTTDYLEVYVYIVASSPTVYGASYAVAFSGAMVRSA